MLYPTELRALEDDCSSAGITEKVGTPVSPLWLVPRPPASIGMQEGNDLVATIVGDARATSLTLTSSLSVAGHLAGSQQLSSYSR